MSLIRTLAIAAALVILAAGCATEEGPEARLEVNFDIWEAWAPNEVNQGTPNTFMGGFTYTTFNVEAVELHALRFRMMIRINREHFGVADGGIKAGDVLEHCWINNTAEQSRLMGPVQDFEDFIAFSGPDRMISRNDEPAVLHTAITCSVIDTGLAEDVDVAVVIESGATISASQIIEDENGRDEFLPIMTHLVHDNDSESSSDWIDPLFIGRSRGEGA